jgi:carbon-monoxide dehydrogenase catalytic subunit
VSEKSVDQASLKMLDKAAQEGIETAWDRFEKQQPQCGFGLLGICCRNCNMGPCRIDPFGDEPQQGVCGATADTIAARNLLRMIAAGAAAHSDHGRDIVTTLYETAAGETQGYSIKDEGKLSALAAEFGISEEGRSKEEVAQEIARQAMDEFGMIKNNLQFLNRVPEKNNPNTARVTLI